MRVLKPILRNVIWHPLRTVIIDDRKSWKGYELYFGALHLAKAIDARTDREHVGIILPTSGLFPMSLIAVWMLGRTAVPLNYLLKEEDLEYVIRDAGLDTIVTAGAMLEHIAPLPSDINLLKVDEMKFGGMPPLRKSKTRPDDFLAALLYTSGTSGKPKGVMLSNGNLAANVEQIREHVSFSSSETFLGVLPQFHSFGLTALTLLPLSVGATVVYTARFLPKKILSLLKKHRPNVLIAIPSMYNALLRAKNATRDHFTSLQYCVSGGEPLPEAVFDGLREQFGVTLNEGYGLTETAPVTNWCRPDEHRRKSVGRAVPRVHIRIVGDDGADRPAETEGEIRIKGPNVMQGYYKLDDATRDAFDEQGYFRTGDMGKLDGDGHLYITGRIKEMLIIGGENVFPREIEEVLNTHPSVQDSAVIGMQDDSRGEVALAFVEIAEGETFDETALRSHCRDQLAQYKVPREIRMIEALPRNATGKIMRRELSV